MILITLFCGTLQQEHQDFLFIFLILDLWQSSGKSAMSRLQEVIIEPNVLFGYKIFPGSDFVTLQAQVGQSEADWSGLYAQFNLQHAVAYLPNHFDRGHKCAMLVSITTRIPIKCLVYSDVRFCETSVSSAEKAAALRHSVAEHSPTSNIMNCGKPLLQFIGEQLKSIVVMYDAEDLECAIPHCMLTDENFIYKTHAVIHGDSNNSYMIRSVSLCCESLKQEDPHADGCEEEMLLSKDQRADMNLLARKFEDYIRPNHCAWIDQYTRNCV